MNAEAGEQGSDDGSDEPQYARKCLLCIFFHRVDPPPALPVREGVVTFANGGILGDLVLKVKHIDY